MRSVKGDYCKPETDKLNCNMNKRVKLDSILYCINRTL